MLILSTIFTLLPVYQELIPPPSVYIEEKVEHDTRADVACSCVAFVRQYRLDIPSINAEDMVPATTTPREGAVALMYYPHSGMSHIALVLEVGDGWLRILDANYKPCTITERVIELPDRVIGYM